jgi:cohesin complex subunit SA-1/2
MIEQVITILCTYLLWKTRVVLADSTRPSAEDHALRQALKQQRDSIVDGLLDFVVGEDSQVTEFVKRAVSCRACALAVR